MSNLSAKNKATWPKKEFTWIEGRTLKISIPFTWRLSHVRNLLMQRDYRWDGAEVGGPAVDLMPGYFDDLDFVTIGKESPGILQRINPYATRTTMGCVRKCKFCGIGKGQIEGGGLVELNDWPDLPVICDNNLLAASQSHFDKVIERLKVHEWADFNQGLDPRLLTEYHAKRIAEIKYPVARLALDHMGGADTWENAFVELRKAKIALKKITSYCLIGFNSSPEEAWKRCEWIEDHGILAYPMWYHPLDALEHNAISPEQRALGWDEDEYKAIMQYYYKHRGKKRYVA